jgi:RNA polymerase sigma factor (sigma-70 family)
VDLPVARPGRFDAATGPVELVREDDLITGAYEAHGRELYSFLARATRDPAIAEDLLQEVFLRLTRELRGGRHPEQLRAWLYKVASNLVISRGRRQTTALRWLARFGATEARGPAVESPESGLLRRERATQIDAALTELGPDARLGLLLSGEGFSGREIAASIGRSEAATRTLLCRARLRVRERLDELDREAER